jgi:hypothetical protein
MFCLLLSLNVRGCGNDWSQRLCKMSGLREGHSQGLQFSKYRDNLEHKKVTLF